MEPKGLCYCPKCGMELLEFGYQTIRIDQCSGCDGIWLDRGELEAVEHMHREGILSLELDTKWVRAKEKLDQTTPEELEERKRQTHMRCPRCSSALEEIQDHGIPVDRCTTCGGVWLDAGEFDQVAGAELLMARLHRFLHRQ